MQATTRKKSVNKKTRGQMISYNKSHSRWIVLFFVFCIIIVVNGFVFLNNNQQQQQHHLSLLLSLHHPSSVIVSSLSLSINNINNINKRKRRIDFLQLNQYKSSSSGGDEISNDDNNNSKSTKTTTTTTPISAATRPTIPTTYRTIQSLEKFARLPVWPVLNGVVLFIISKLFGNEISAQVEHTITGRVCPNFFNYNTISNPFIMLVHHCHSFYQYDIIRYIQKKFILPEGFPSHPHRGFITLTYILHGGFVHRDSQGIRQLYGNSNGANSNNDKSNTNNVYNGKHTQWLMTGSGILHEEMFHVDSDTTNNNSNNRQELYQIWINVPAQYKMDPPQSLLIGGTLDTPTVILYNNDNDNDINNKQQLIEKSRTTILIGSYNNKVATTPTYSDMVVLHVELLQKGCIWEYTIPTHYTTAIIYIRHGSSLLVHSGNNNSNIEHNNNNIIPVHYTAYLNTNGNTIVVESLNGICDFMLLAGEPINEQCVAQGSMVMTTPKEINQAYIDYSNGLFGIPWDYKLSDTQWLEHISSTNKNKNKTINYK